MVRQTRIMRMPGGRRLAFDEYGPADGVPRFYFHGAPSARIEPLLFDLPALAERNGVRLIAADRPGVGLSDYQRGRTLGAWPVDVAALADHLGLHRFAVLGFSGGGPYALACAARIPDRLLAVGAVSGVGPEDVPGLVEGINRDSLRFMRLSVEKPRVHRLVTLVMALTARFAPRRLLAQAVSALPEPDARFMARPPRGEIFARLVVEVARRGARGAQHDTALMVRPWDIDPARIQVPVQLWHGEEDRNAPIAAGRYLAARIPQAQLATFAGEGHLSLLGNRGEEVLQALSRAGTAVPTYSDV
jgi:pimeloyl-ACP methyl ester carboxylesterase